MIQERTKSEIYTQEYFTINLAMIEVRLRRCLEKSSGRRQDLFETSNRFLNTGNSLDIGCA